MRIISDLINVLFKLTFMIFALATWGSVDIIGDIDDFFDT